MVKESKSEWTKIKPQEVEKLVVDLARKGIPSEKIGLILRDQHGIPKARLLGKKIGQILKENKIENKSEENNLANKIESLKKHFATHKHDYITQRTGVKYAAQLRKMKARSQ